MSELVAPLAMASRYTAISAEVRPERFCTVPRSSQASVNFGFRESTVRSRCSAARKSPDAKLDNFRVAQRHPAVVGVFLEEDLELCGRFLGPAESGQISAAVQAGLEEAVIQLEGAIDQIERALVFGRGGTRHPPRPSPPGRSTEPRRSLSRPPKPLRPDVPFA